MTTDFADWVGALPVRLLSLADYDVLPDDLRRRVELVEGVPHVSPSPILRHQRIARRLADALDAAVPEGWCTALSVDVLIEGDPTPTVREPDIVVLRTACPDHVARLDPADVLAVVEVLSPGSRRTDRVAKLAEYAEVGIRHYALVEPGPPVVLTELVLEDGTYRVRAEHRGRSTADLGFETPIDLDALDRPR